MALALEGWRVAAAPAAPAACDERLVRVEKAIAAVRIAVTASVAGIVALGVPPNVSEHPRLVWGLISATAVYAVLVPLFPGLLHRRGGSRLLNAVDAGLSLAIIAVTGPVASPMVALLFLAIICTGMRFGLADALRAAVVEGAVFAALVFLVPEPSTALDEQIQIALWWPLYLVFAAVFTGALARIAEAEQAQRLRAEARADQESEARRQAQEAWHQREELLRVVIHEFRTPVASLGALARYLSGESPSTQDEAGMHRALQLIQVHANHLDDMVSALGDVAASGSADIDSRIRVSDVFLPELLRAAVAAGGGDESTVNVMIDPPGTIARIDATRVRRIVTNLVENALRHNTPGEPVDVRARLIGSRLEIAVADRGEGLSEDDLDLAFRQYATFGERRGTSGLGLWIVDELTRRLGGSVEAHPRADGPGLEVRLTLPLVPADAPRPGRTSDSTAGAPGRNGGSRPALNR